MFRNNSDNVSLLFANEENVSNPTPTVPGGKPMVDEDLSALEFALLSMVVMAITVAGLVGNTLVIVAVAGDAKMRKAPMNSLLLNLAVADVANVIACMPEVVLKMWNRGWLLPDDLCPFLRYLEEVFLYTSLLTQVAVCIERYHAIALPMKMHLLCSRRKVSWWCVVLWCTSSLCALPHALWQKVSRASGEPSCNISGVPGRTVLLFRSVECLAFYILPLILIVVLYTCISIKLWSGNRCLHEGRDEQGQTETLKARQNVVKMLIVCICVYFVCYSPIQVLFLARALFDKQVRFNLLTKLALHCLAYACSSTNPLLYTIFSSRFRRKFATLLRCRRYRRNGDRRSPDHCRPGRAIGCSTNGGDSQMTSQQQLTTRLLTNGRASTDSHTGNGFSSFRRPSPVHLLAN